MLLAFMMPGILAGLLAYFLVAMVNWFIEAAWSKDRRLRAHSRLVIHCLIAIAFCFFLVLTDGGESGVMLLVIGGFLLVGCLLSFITAAGDKSSDSAKKTKLDQSVDS